MAAFAYRLVPTSPAFEIGGEAVEEQTVMSEREFMVGDVVPASPGKWVVERVGPAGITQWASEAVERADPRTRMAFTLYCRVDA